MKLSRFFVIFSFVLCGHVFADGIQVAGTLPYTMQPTKSAFSYANTASLEIGLLRLHLSPEARQVVEKRTQQVLAKATSAKMASSASLAQVQLGMNGVPVLDQGRHGTCVTFANTAAIDAILNQGDYISQLCLLQLGRYIENNAFRMSGWDGSLGSWVLSQLSVHGFVSKETQRTLGCGGEKEYPARSSAPNSDMSVADYHQISEKLAEEVVTWSSLLDIYQVAFQETSTEITLEHVKKAIQAGDRVTFGLMIADYQVGTVGAVAKHHAKNDTWALTPEIARDIEDGTDLAGHEMVITGYNDNAEAVDPKGRSYRGLLTVRNSWGSNIGDRGEFYVTYDYFKALVMEAQRIRKM